MRKYTILFVVIILLMFVGACNTTDTNKEKSVVSENKKQILDTVFDKGNIVFIDDYIMNIENIYNGEVVNDLIVTNYKYEPDVEFSFILNGEFIADGEVMIDEMWGELAIQFDKITNPHTNIKIQIDDDQKQLIDFSYFRNQEDLMLALTEEEVKILETGGKVKLTVKVRDVKAGGKIDGYGDLSVKFVEILR